MHWLDKGKGEFRHRVMCPCVVAVVAGCVYKCNRDRRLLVESLNHMVAMVLALLFF